MFSFWGLIARGPLYVIVALLGHALFVAGCVFYARAKGQSGWLGFLGLFSLLGLVFLMLGWDDETTPPGDKKRQMGHSEMPDPKRVRRLR
jgi:hypothetical protein